MGAKVTALSMGPAQADAVLRYANATARSLHDPREYIGSVVSTKPLPSPHTTGEGGLRR